MSSPDREAEDTRPSVVDAVSASAVVTKEDEDVEMADDDPVTDLFGGLSRGSLSNKVIYKCFISDQSILSAADYYLVWRISSVSVVSGVCPIANG